MQRKIKVLIVKPNELPEVSMIPNTLEAKQKIVGGYIEYAYNDKYSDVVFICNEEGKINGLPFNRCLGEDIIAGDFLIVGDNSEIGEDISLTDIQINKYKTVFGEKSISETQDRLEEIYSSFGI